MTEPQKPRWPFAIAAAVMPILGSCAAFVVVLILLASSGGSAAELADLEGIQYSVIFLALLATVGVTALLALSALGYRVPAAATIGVAVLPWLMASVSIIVAFGGLEEEFASATPEIRATALARTVAQCLNMRALGTLVTGTLMGSACISLGIAAIGQRAPNRSWVGALIGFGITLLLVVIPMYLGVVTFAGPRVILFALPFCAGILGAALAGFGAGDDEPHGRGSALAAAAPLALGLAWVAAAILLSTATTVEIFSALAYAAPEMRSELIAAGAEESAALRFFESWGAVIFFLPALGVAIWAATRSRPSLGRIAGAVAALFVCGFVIGLDAVASRQAGRTLFSITRLPWDEHEEFEPVELAGDWLGLEVDTLVTQSEVVAGPDDRLPTSGLATPSGVQGLVERWSKLLPPGPVRGGEGAMGAPDPRHSSNRYGVDEGGDTRDEKRLWILPGDLDRARSVRIDLEPSLSLAFDRRLGANELRALIAAADSTRAVSLVLVGTLPLNSPRGYHETLERTLYLEPFLAAFVTSCNSRRALLARGLPPGFADSDPVLYHGTIAPNGPMVLELRTGSTLPEKTIERGRRSRAQLMDSIMRTGESREEAIPLAFLTIDDAATARDVAEIVNATAESGFQPVLLPGREIPGNPFKAATVEPPPEERLIGDGREVRGKMKRGRASIVGGSGTLSGDAVRQTVGRAIGGIKACYERGLRRDPTISGRLTMVFTIGGGGRVVDAQTSSSTLPVEIGDCVAGRIRSLRFPPPEGGDVTVSYPFLFAPQS